MEYGWIWVAVIVFAIVIEITTDQLIGIWFIPGAIISTILEFVKVKIYWQILVFLVLSLIGIFFIRRFVTKHTKGTDTKTNTNAIIGEKCVVTEKIDNFAGCGQVKVHGQIWSARGCDEFDIFEEGEILKIVAIEGVKLICKKI